MISPAPRPVFDGFGTWTLAPRLAWPQAGIIVNGELHDKRKRILREAPPAPGIYGMLDSEGELIYIGQSKSLRKRLISYFARSAPHKAQQIVAHTRRLLWEAASDPFAAMLRELELIRRWRPRFNHQGRPGRVRRAYLCVGRGPAAQAYLSAGSPTREGWTFGPVPTSRDYRRSVRWLNDCFGLRDCRRRSDMSFSDQLELFSREKDAMCVRGAAGTCLAPCATACSRAEYRDRIRAVVDFLTGNDIAVLGRVQAEMQSASRSLKFELAARLRDAHEDLTSTTAPVEMTFYVEA